MSQKNCHNCIHLEYYQADYEEFQESGYSCNRRNYDGDSRKENEHLSKLNTDPAYLSRSKKCCELFHYLIDQKS